MKHSIALGASSGALLTLSLPKPDWHPLVWIALLPLLFLLTRANGWRSAGAGAYAAGLVFFAGTSYWITETMTVYGGLAPAAAFGVCLLYCLALSLFFLVFGLALYAVVSVSGVRGLLLAPSLWITMELARTYFPFGGFPWMLSGYALAPYSGVLQLAAWTGVYGLSFVATAVNAAFVYAALKRGWRWAAGAFLAIATCWALPVFPETEGLPDSEIDIRIVQANIPLGRGWNPPESVQLLDELHDLSTAPGISTSPVRLIVWPETPAPFELEDPDFRQRVRNIARQSGSHFLFGYVDHIGDEPSNSAALVDALGNVVSRYDKMHLVPFGEYVPMRKLLSFADKLVQQVGEFAPGTEVVVSKLDGHGISTVICYESIFPDLVRQSVALGSELIVVITDDGWFGHSSAPFQHLRMGVVRAVENRRYVVRSANTGISAIVDPYGRIVSQTTLDTRTVLDGTVRFRSEQTFYTTYGDVFAYANAAAVILFGLWSATRTVRKRRPS